MTALRTPCRALAPALLLALLACNASTSSSGPTPPAVPTVPQGVLALAGDGRVTVSWEASTGAVTGYHLKRSGTSGGPYTQVAAPAGTRQVDAGLTNGVTYHYVVSAYGEAGESADSAEVQASPSAELTPLPDDDRTRNQLGMNVWFLSDWDGSLAFVDLMKHARPWKDADWQDEGTVDADGWPTADASTVVLTGTPAEVNGTHKLSFHGQADISLMWAGGSVSNVSYDAPSNTTTADFTYAVGSTGSVGIVLRNTRRTAESPLHSGFTDLHLYRGGYASDGSAVFTTPFLTALGKAGAVRLMDWTATNANMVERWEDRARPGQMVKLGPGWTGQGGTTWTDSPTGVALEHQIQLCNTLGVDCWINIPVVADDTFIRKLALALRYGTDGVEPYTSRQAHPVYPPLDPSLRVYLEYANEIWNSAGGFRCFYAIQDLVSTLPGGHPVNTPATDSVWTRMWRWPAYRLAVASDIFRDVYGDASMMNRIRPVLMTQQGDGQGTLSAALSWLHAYARGRAPAREVNSYVFGAGGSAYYQVNDLPADLSDLDAFFAAGNYPDAQMVRGVGVDAVWAGAFGLRRVAYEGGPSLDPFSDPLARAVNADPRIQDLMVETHDAWSGQGGELLMYYTLRGGTPWEFTPSILDSDTPKLAALDELGARSRAAVTLGAALPGALDGRDLADYRVRTGYDFNTTCDGVPCLGGNDAGELLALPGHAAAPFTGTLTVRGITYTGATLDLFVNGALAGRVTLPVSDHLADSTSVTAQIPAGLVSVRMEVVTGGLDFLEVRVAQ
ncbi:MAG: fibronectin type III domain-containing protein [Anaeromyxobacter sp.]